MNFIILILMAFIPTQSSAVSKANDFSLVEYEKLLTEKPEIKGENIRVWKIRQNNTIRINLVEMKGELTLHKHPDADHSLMVLEGQLRVRIGDRFLVVGRGDFISIPADVPHKYWSLTPKSVLVSMDAPYYDPAKTITLE